MITACLVLSSGIIHYQLDDNRLEHLREEGFLNPTKQVIGEVDADEYNDHFSSMVPVSVHQVYNPRYFNPDNRRNREKKKNLGIKRFFNFSFDGRGGQEYLIKKDDVPSKKKKLSLEMYSKWPRKKDPRKNYRKNAAKLEKLFWADYDLEVRLKAAKCDETEMGEQFPERDYDREMINYNEEKERSDRDRILQDIFFKEFDDELHAQLLKESTEAWERSKNNSDYIYEEQAA